MNKQEISNIIELALTKVKPDFSNITLDDDLVITHNNIVISIFVKLGNKYFGSLDNIIINGEEEFGFDFKTVPNYNTLTILEAFLVNYKAIQQKKINNNLYDRCMKELNNG